MRLLKLLLLTINFIINFMVDKAMTSKCNPLSITLPQGKLKGLYDLHKTQIMFLGIPYASVNEKFQAPGKPPLWNGTLNADRGSIKCKQYQEHWRMVIGQEDCLVLNVFTPTHKDTKPFPVMVFIHGGGFFKGSNTESIYNPKYLVQEKVIIVTINYRLGAFGFLCLPLKEAPGNAGLKDQIAALKWIQNNIAYFGGDPNSVTLFGESVGGASGNYLMLSYSAEGLFHRAIIESETILAPQAFDYNPIESASRVALRLGYNTSDPKELLQVYKNIPVDDIIEASSSDTTNDPFANYIFRPGAETAITNGRALITKNPSELLKKNGLNISAIIGFNNKEGIQWASPFFPITIQKVKENFDKIIPLNLQFKNCTEKISFTDDIMTIYFSNGFVTDNLIDYFTDSVIKYPLIAVSEHFSVKPHRNVYNYYYTYNSIRNIHKLSTPLSYVEGADHADELFSLFEPALFNLLPPNSKDRAMITNMVKLWTSFAKTGEPSTANIRWHPNGEHLKFIELGDEIKMITLPDESRLDFWRKVYDKYGRM